MRAARAACRSRRPGAGSAEPAQPPAEGDDQHQLDDHQRVEARPAAEDRRRLVVAPIVHGETVPRAAVGLTRLANSRHAPGTPAGSWRKNASAVKTNWPRP